MGSLNSNSLPHFRDIMPQLQQSLEEGKHISFPPRGTSMLPMLRQGIDTVELTAAPEKLKKFDLPLYLRDNGQYVLHRIVKVGDAYTCVGDNQYELEYPVRQDQILAVTCAFTRNGKRIPVTAFSYRLYCVFWHYSRPIRHILVRMKYLFVGLKQKLAKNKK